MRSRTIALAVAAFAVTLPATASARPSASVDGSVIRIVDSAGMPDTVTITLSSGTNWRIQGVDGGSGCTAAAGNVAFCDAAGRTVEIALAAGNDTLTYGGALPITTTDLGDGDDRVTSSASAGHTIAGGAGNDTLTLTGFAPPGAAGQPMTLNGGADADVLDVAGRRSADVLGGGTGDDRVSYFDRGAGTPVTVTFDSAGNDGGTAEGDNVNDDIERVTGSQGIDTLTGDATDQVLDGGPGADVLNGAGGADTLSFASRSTGVTADLGAGSTSDADVISGFENLLGGESNDTLTGSDAANVIDGGPGGNDVLDGRLGADQFLGGGGTLKQDAVSYESRPTAVTASLDGVSNDPDGDLYVSNINALRGTTANDTLVGGTGEDRLFGLGGNDVLAGGPPPAPGSGEAVRDFLDGGAGARDRVDYSTQGNEFGIFIMLGTAEGEDALVDIEDVTGSPRADTIHGDAGANQIDGRDGNDTINGGLGADQLTGGGGFDRVTYADAARTTGVTASLDGVSNDPDGDVLAEVEALQGTQFGDTLLGGPQADDLKGLGGDDVLRGGTGPDTLDGEAGDDTLDGGPGTDPDVLIGGPPGAVFVGTGDIADYSSRTTAVNLTLRSFPPATTIDGDTVSGVRSIKGGSGNDRLVGNSLRNVITGGPGIDRIDGKGADDVLAGDAGNDVIGPLVPGSPTTCTVTSGSFPVCIVREFVANPPPDGNDTVTGGDGNDLVSSVDGFADAAVNCGKGTDVAEIDLLDPFPSISCEQFANGARDQHPLVRFPSRTARLSRARRLAVRMACPRARGRRTCKGALSVRRGTRTVARTRYLIRRGRARTVRVRVKGKRPRTVTAIARGRDTRRRALTTRAKLRVVRRG